MIFKHCGVDARTEGAHDTSVHGTEFIILQLEECDLVWSMGNPPNLKTMLTPNKAICSYGFTKTTGTKTKAYK